MQISVFISCNLSDLTLVQLKFFIHQRAPLCRLSCESQICYKWLLLDGAKGERKPLRTFKLPVASSILILPFKFFRGNALRFPLCLLMGRPSQKCLKRLSSTLKYLLVRLFNIPRGTWSRVYKIPCEICVIFKVANIL